MRTPLRALGLVAAVLTAPLSAPLSAQTGPVEPALAGVAPLPALRAPLPDAGAAPWLASAIGSGGTAVAPRQEVRRDRRKGALWGGGIGLVAGGLLGGLTVESDDGDGLVESAATGEAVVLGALVGAGLGALLGATVFAPSRPMPSGAERGMAVVVAPRRDGDGSGVRVGLRWRR